MRWAILSDVHGNLEAFRAVIEDLRAEGAEKTAFLGDVVGYGADPNECIALLRDLTDWVIAGNHDYGTVGLTHIESFNPMAQAALFWTRDQLSVENQAFLRRLLLSRKDGSATFVHSTPNQPEEWYYLFTFPEAEEAFLALAGDLAFVGHSHRPLILTKAGSEGVDAMDAEETTLKPGVRYIINVGSVGQPRDGHPEAAYGLFDDEAHHFRLKRIPYDVETAQKKILRAGLPPFLAQRLSRGI
jgi:diadenosine tetraphosphatase ApaH/serine/threonine PP2A family protein phosphatase